MTIKNGILYWLDISSKIASIAVGIGIVFLTWLGYHHTSRIAYEREIKELIASFASEWIGKKQQAFSAYTNLRVLSVKGKISEDDWHIQRLLAENISKSVLMEPYPDRDIPKHENAFRLIKYIDKFVRGKESPEVIFTKILFIKENKKAIKEFKMFIGRHQKHWLIPWAYYNLASISILEGKKGLGDKYQEKFEKKARDLAYDTAYIEEMKRRINERKETFEKHGELMEDAKKHR
jgi:hypothetical protein